MIIVRLFPSLTVVMVFCMICCKHGPWAPGRSLTTHQRRCRQEKQETAAATNTVEDHNQEMAANIPTPRASPSPTLAPPSPLPQRPPSPPIQQYTASGRPKRNTRLPARYRDELPEPPPAPEIEPHRALSPTDLDGENGTQTVMYRTEPNAAGLYKIYPYRPSHDPDSSLTLDDVCGSSFTSQAGTDRPASSPPPSVTGAAVTESDDDSPPWFPFLSSTIARLMCWVYDRSSSQKSRSEVDSLVHDVILKDDFCKDDLLDFSIDRETARLDKGFDLPTEAPSEDGTTAPPTPSYDASKGWQTRSVKIRLPASGVHCPEDQTPEFEIKGVLIRPLLDVLFESFQGPMFNQLHLTPFELCHDPSKGRTSIHHDPDREPFSPLPPGHQHIYGEVYSSPAMMEAHRSLPRDPELETVVAAYMFWSDSTHLANFGNASLWPLYTLWGNQSKYTRGKPSSESCHHQAYIPSLPDDIADQYRHHFGVPPTPQMLTHLKRELMHAVWGLLLSPEFLNAYEHGVIIKCFDGISRRFYPRLLTYSADYPEKVLLSTIKYLGAHPCPRCLVKKENIPNLGTTKDTKTRLESERRDSPWLHRVINAVRRWIFENGRSVSGTAVDKVLKLESLVPTRNAFSCLNRFGFNYYRMFVPDLLHEFELGVWKSVFTHLIRVLSVIGAEAVSKLNERYRQVPTFGTDTIRRFHNNAAAMKKLAARDFEDLLQCAIPVFEGLFPAAAHSKIILDLLFILAEWHALAKLRMHTDNTLDYLDQCTKQLGQQLRKFRDKVCPQYATKELPREYEARLRRKNKDAPSHQPSSSPKFFNLTTYKLHALGDYGELAHRRVKRFYARTNKRKYVRQIAKHERRQRLLRALRRRLENENQLEPVIEVPQPPMQEERLPPQSPRSHHQISEERRRRVNVYQFAAKHEGDPAIENFIPRLKTHLLGRVHNLPYDGDDREFSAAELDSIAISNDTLYLHKVLRVNYTTYDGRREQDSINPWTHADFMTESPAYDETDPSSSPYWFGRIVLIFHVETLFTPAVEAPPQRQRFEVLFVRWYGDDPTFRSGFSRRRLPRIGFVPRNNTWGWGDAFGFLSPAHVIRAAHIIPAFHHGQTKDLLPYPSIARHGEELDWTYYYVNFFVDRDMFVRFRGGLNNRSEAPGDGEGDESPDDENAMDVDEAEPVPPAFPHEVLEADVADNDMEMELDGEEEEIEAEENDEESEKEADNNEVTVDDLEIDDNNDIDDLYAEF